MNQAVFRIVLFTAALIFSGCSAKEPTPRETYETYLDTVNKAASVAEVMHFYSEQARKKVEDDSSPSKLKLFWRLEKEEARVRPLRLMEEKVTGDTAVLVYDVRNQVSGPPDEIKSAIATIHMKRENGKWRIDSTETSVDTKLKIACDDFSGIESFSVTEAKGATKTFETGVLRDEMGFVDKTTGSKVDIVTNMMGVSNSTTGKTDWCQRYVALVVPIGKNNIFRISVKDVAKRPIKMASPPILYERDGSNETVIKLYLLKKGGFEFRLELETTK